MKSKVIKITIGALCLMGSATLAQAQQKFGDNLGNHKAAKDLNINTHKILNASGVAIGTATLTNESIALQIDGQDKSILISRTDDLAKIVNPVNGMIVYLENGTDSRFYVRQNNNWSTFATALKKATALGDPDDFGYTITFDPLSQETILSLSPATEDKPGIVTIGAQDFGGAKTFKGNVVIDGTNTLTVGIGATTLGGTLTVADDVTVGTSAAAANTALNGNLTVSQKTTLAGKVDDAGTEVSGVVIPNVLDAEGLATERYVVLDENGNMKKSKLSAAAFDKRIVAVPAGTSALFTTDNIVVKIVLTGITSIKQNDGVVVNFDAVSSLDLAEYLTITNAAATADETVTVWVADLRQPTDDPYEAPDFASKNFVVTRYQQVD